MKNEELSGTRNENETPCIKPNEEDRIRNEELSQANNTQFNDSSFFILHSSFRKLRTIEMNRLSVEEFKEAQKLPLIVVLDDVRSLYNVGSVFRTCDAFRVEAIYLCGITATPPSNEIHKTALGAEDSVDWKYFKTAEEAVHDLHQNGYFVYSVEQAEGSTKLNEVGWKKEEGGSKASLEKSKKDKSTSSVDPSLSPRGETRQPSTFHLPPSKYAVVFGNEVKGVHQSVIDLSDGCLEIPQFGTKHSMNVSVTAGIVIWEFAKQLIY
jgi:tRNA G18 (ribose-2'-O)-methylase SpoU